jgi:hypothetical protein
MNSKILQGSDYGNALDADDKNISDGDDDDPSEADSA